MKRTASAVWTGDLKEGRGKISTESGVLSDTQYSFSTRFEDGKGTNPEELIAAAHAGCFSMALSAELGKLGKTADSIQTEAELTMLKTDAGFTITALPLLAAKEWGIFNANNLDMEVILMQSALVPAALTQGDIDYQAGVGPASVNATMSGFATRAIWFSRYTRHRSTLIDSPGIQCGS